MNYKGIERKKARWGWVFVTPAILMFLLFSLYPMLNALYNTFFNIKLLSRRPPKFVGLDNYIYILTSHNFWNSMRATLVFTLSAFIPLTLFSLVLGLSMTSRKKSSKAFQLIYYSPAVLSSVVAALIWMLIFDPRGIANGFVNTIFNTPGINHNWLTDPLKLQMSTAMIYIWKYIGYFTIIYITGIAKIPDSVLEAATIDGSSRFQIIMKIIVPLLRPTTAMISIVAMLNCLKSFSTQYLFMQRGAPVEPINVVTLNIYNTAMRDLRISVACVMSIILFVIMMSLTLLRMKVSAKDEISY